MHTLALALALALPGLAAGTTVLPLTREEIAARSDTIVRARVLVRTPARSERTGRILTRTRLQVLETYKGKARREIELEQMGGTLGGATLVVPGDARIDQGEEVVLHLRCEGKERCHLFGLALGKFGVRSGPDGKRIAVRDLQGLSDSRSGPLGRDEIPLATLERELRRRP
ncbi:MAG: hypothetical protein HY901_34565 [Deltaproteobacteria bacterium]|nr:hypothetical protein [Deltaproteobacteria bacterium]